MLYAMTWSCYSRDVYTPTSEMMSAPSIAPASVTAMVILFLIGSSSYPNLSPT